MEDIEEFRLPDVGEGLTEAEVVSWHVAIGDTVAVNDLLVDIETAKSVVELPSPFAGTVTALLVQEGTTVPVGTPLITIGRADASGGADEPTTGADAADERPTVLVGPGPKAAAPRRRRLGARPGARLGARLGAHGVGVAGTTPARGIPATTPADPGPDPMRAPTPPAIARPDHRETRRPISGVRKATAAAMTRSAFTAPHVTEWLSVDVTRTMEMVGSLRGDGGWAGVRVTPLLFVARALLSAAHSYPEINATWDEAAQEIAVRHYVNLGIAAATPRGLIVPNIKDAHSMSLRELGEALGELVDTARSGRTRPAQTSGGTLTITNIGAFGVDAGTPILNPGEAAILAFGAVRPTPWVVDGELAVRQVTQLALSFDHRLVDGELGSRVLARVGELLHDPGATFLYC